MQATCLSLSTPVALLHLCERCHICGCQCVSSKCLLAVVSLQEIKVLRSTVLQRDKERAERATLVAQEKLVRGKVRRHTHMDLDTGREQSVVLFKWSGTTRRTGRCHRLL